MNGAHVSARVNAILFGIAMARRGPISRRPTPKVLPGDLLGTDLLLDSDDLSDVAVRLEKALDIELAASAERSWSTVQDVIDSAVAAATGSAA